MMSRPSRAAVMSLRGTNSSAPIILIARRLLDRIAGIDMVEEFHPFDDTSAVNIEAGDDAFGKHE